MTGKASRATLLKEYGYFVSTVSVLLLGTVAWEDVQDRPLLVMLLIGAMGFSILGMYLRWRAHLAQHREDAATGSSVVNRGIGQLDVIERASRNPAHE